MIHIKTPEHKLIQMFQHDQQYINKMLKKKIKKKPPEGGFFNHNKKLIIERIQDSGHTLLAFCQSDSKV